MATQRCWNCDRRYNTHNGAWPDEYCTWRCFEASNAVDALTRAGYENLRSAPEWGPLRALLRSWGFRIKYSKRQRKAFMKTGDTAILKETETP